MWPSRHVLNGRSFKWITVTLLIPEITKVEKMKWCVKENPFNRSDSTLVLMATLVRHHTSNEWWLLLQVQFKLEATFLVNLFLQNVFVWQNFCQIFLSDLLIMKNPTGDWLTLNLYIALSSILDPITNRLFRFYKVDSYFCNIGTKVYTNIPQKNKVEVNSNRNWTCTSCVLP